MSGLSLGNAETLLTQRAADYLVAGPADPQALISHVCQISGPTRGVAEHMAAALFAGHQRFSRNSDGYWILRHPEERGDEGPRNAEDKRKKKGKNALLGTQQSIVAEVPQDDICCGANHSGRVFHNHDDALANESFVVVDCETTGPRAWSGDRVTEVAVVRVHRGVAELVFDTLVNPDRAIPPTVSALTNITRDMVARAPRFRDICPQLLGVLEGNIFVAHNADFDWRFLSMEIERATRRPLHGRRICTVKFARKVLPQLRRRNLDALQNFYGVENYARHRAGGDAVATASVFLRMLDAARDRGYSSLDDLESAISRGTGGRKRRRRPPALPHSVTDDSYA
ncbi:MAG TPA: 3'-5' exonuclease [Gemmatimonadaceae bacterium]|jgi:DNA polymerase-3 subunit epsilon